MTPTPPVVHGLLLAAGAGRRMGTPKALVRDPDGTTWLHRALGVLAGGGCAGTTVVLGAAADEARTLLGSWDGPPPGVVVADDWDDGMGSSLRAGLASLSGPAADGADAVLVLLVDLPDVGADVVARVRTACTGAADLARAAYDGVPGHPVLLGRDHWAGVAAAARGDRGARDYLAARPVRLVECGDLAGGQDVDSR